MVNFLLGQLNYSRLHGANGPMAYPAGHAWLYTALYIITTGGLNTKLAQYISLAVHITNLALVFRLLIRTERTPPYILTILSIGATRVRGIACIHLFNDPIAMLLLHGSLNLFIGRFTQTKRFIVWDCLAQNLF